MTKRVQRRARKYAAPVPARSLNYRQLQHPFEPQRIMSDDAVANIHDTALRTLEELGMKILSAEARDILAEAGAIVDHDTMIVRIDRDTVQAAIDTCPKSIRYRGASPERDQAYALGSMIFAPGAGCPNVSDRIRGRRPGSAEAFEETTKLQQSFDVIHLLGPSAEPQDIAPHLRHYWMMQTQVCQSDKPVTIYSRGRAQVADGFTMLQMARGLSDEEFGNGVWAKTIVNTNSPRLLDVPMAEGIIDFAKAGQLLIITPFCLAGAMAPISIPGALMLQHAECLACMVLSQTVKPGAPVSYGGFSSNVDMKSGSPAFGTPEHVKLIIGTGQMARHIGMPWRSAAGSAGVTNDMQSAGENIMGLWGAMQANATLTIHAAGWLEGGLTFGYEKFINDMEFLQSIAELAQPVKADDAEIAYSALQETEPGGHFFAAEHTMERYRTAFYEPLVADLDNFGTWEANGAVPSQDRATSIWQKILKEFQPPEVCAPCYDRIASFIERRTKQGGAPIAS